MDDEEPTITSLRGSANEDIDPDDETQDFRFLTSLSGPLPKRGEKDFEPHGTRAQENVLESSRKAMSDALGYTRTHVPKSWTRAFYYGDEVDVKAQGGRKGLDNDHVVLVEGGKGPHFKSMGKMTLGTNTPDLWLLPEEALYLVERGNLDLWWPGRYAFKGKGVENEEVEEGEDTEEGIPMSLQAAYALLIGDDSKRGKVSLDRYTVYANLKRTGYIVFRAPDWDPTKPSQALSQEAEAVESQSLFTWLWRRVFAAKPIEHQPYGPLIKPGMYRSYNSMYQQLAVIPRHKPSRIPTNPAPLPDDPYRVIFLLWQADNTDTFAKSNPGPPNFRLALTDSRSSSIPTLTQMTSLLESTKWDPPSEEHKGPAKLYQRLKHGYRNVVLAVIDQGIVSYLRLTECAFGEEKIYERFDGGNVQGGKRGGGYRGRGRGRARGRGRGN